MIQYGFVIDRPCNITSGKEVLGLLADASGASVKGMGISLSRELSYEERLRFESEVQKELNLPIRLEKISSGLTNLRHS